MDKYWYIYLNQCQKLAIMLKLSQPGISEKKHRVSRYNGCAALKLDLNERIVGQSLNLPRKFTKKSKVE